MAESSRLPSYRKHKSSGQAVVTLTTGFGGRRDVLLGKFGTAASRKEYDRVLLEWIGNGRRLQPASSDLSINELVLAYWNACWSRLKWEEGKGSCQNVKDAMRILKQLYGKEPASSFGPIPLKACRQHMIGLDWSRKYINRQVQRITHVFKWAGGEDLLPAAIHDQLTKVEGLRKGKTTARETKKVKPVAVEMVEATIPFMQPTVAAMVQFELATGCRPDEVCRIRPMDLDMKRADCWVYTPGSDQGDHGEHKTAHLELEKLILIGPRAQAILMPYLGTKTDAFCFSPAKSEEARSAARREARVSPMTPSQLKRRRKRSRRRSPRDRFDVNTYRRAIARACEFAFPPPGDLAKRDDESKTEWAARLTPEQKADLQAWRKKHTWAPNRLRHTRGTQLRKHGLDMVSTILGHQSVTTSQVYAEKDIDAAIALVAKIG
ncbi:site-specific integrase [soil metagenome]